MARTARLTGRQPLEGAERRDFLARLDDIAKRVEKIEQDCALLAMKAEADEKFRELYERIATIEEKN